MVNGGVWYSLLCFDQSQELSSRIGSTTELGVRGGSKVGTIHLENTKALLPRSPPSSVDDGAPTGLDVVSTDGAWVGGARASGEAVGDIAEEGVAPIAGVVCAREGASGAGDSAGWSTYSNISANLRI